MNLLSTFLLLFLMEMWHAKHISTPQKVIRIPLTRVYPETSNTRTPSSDLRSTHFGNISIGTDPQTFGVQFDTGSSDFWVFSSLYNSSDSNFNQIQRKHHTYNHADSSTYLPREHNEPQKKEYRSECLYGFDSTDMVSISGEKIKEKFLEVTKANKDEADLVYDGIVGLRCIPLSDSIFSRICRKIGGDNVFSFDLPSPKWNSNKGELILCGKDESKYIEGTMTYFPGIVPGLWTIRIDNVKFESSEEVYEFKKHRPAIVDTGTNDIVGPRRIIENFYRQIKNTTSIDGYIQVPCDTVHLLPILTYHLNGTNYQLAGKDYVQQVHRDTGINCAVRLLPHENNTWILGDVFIRKFYTVFDMEKNRIGFALRK